MVMAEAVCVGSRATGKYEDLWTFNIDVGPALGQMGASGQRPSDRPE